MGYPNGPVDDNVIFALPSTELLMLSTEARYHMDAAQDAGKRVLWRAVPREGLRPAESGWDLSDIADEVMNLTTEPTHVITDFTPFNELDLNYERGDSENDFDNLDERYARIGQMLLDLEPILR